MNFSMPSIKKTPASQELGLGSPLPKETKKDCSIEAQNFSHHQKTLKPLTTLHTKAISPRRFGDIHSMVPVYPQLMYTMPPT